MTACMQTKSFHRINGWYYVTSQTTELSLIHIFFQADVFPEKRMLREDFLCLGRLVPISYYMPLIEKDRKEQSVVGESFGIFLFG